MWIALDQGTAALIAALIGAAALIAAAIIRIPWGAQRRARKLRKRLVELLSDEKPIRSLEWLALRLGIAEAEVAAMLPDVNAHGVRMEGGVKGAALDSRHSGS